MVWTALPLFGWNDYVPEAFVTSCSLDWDARTLDGKMYVLTTAFTCYIFHMITIVFCYSSVIAK